MEHGLTDLSPVELAAVAASLSDSGRAAILISLLDGRARTASELAFVAGVTPQTASGHLARLVDTGLVTVARQGRHRYHRLAGPEAVAALEALAVIAATPPRRPRIPGPRDRLLREGRTCYDHFAGRLGVAIADALLMVRAPSSNAADTLKSLRKVNAGWPCWRSTLRHCDAATARCAGAASIGASVGRTLPALSVPRITDGNASLAIGLGPDDWATQRRPRHSDGARDIS